MTTLVSKNISGNLHSLADYCNFHRIGDYLIAVHVTGGYCVCLFRVPSNLVAYVKTL